jgi:hypothetical protein
MKILRSFIGNVTPGTVAGSKAVVVSADKDISSFRNLTATLVTAATAALTALSIMPRIPIRADVAGAGTTQSNAAAIAGTGFTTVTGADGTVGVKLPVPVAGDVIILKNADAAAAALKVYADAVGTTINGVAGTTAFSVATDCPVTFIAVSASAWNSLPLVAS